MQHPGAEKIEGQGRAGQQHQRNPDVGPQYSQPAMRTAIPGMAAIPGTDSGRIAFFNTPVGVGGNFAGVNTGIPVGRQRQHGECRGKLKPEPLDNIVGVCCILRPLHTDGAGDGQQRKGQDKYKHDGFKPPVAAGAQQHCGQYRKSAHGQGWVYARKYHGDCKAGAANQSAQSGNARGKAYQPQGDWPGETTPWPGNFARHPVQCTQVGIAA